MCCSHHYSTSLSLALHREQHASQFVRCIYRNQQHVFIVKGRSSRPTCFRYMGVRYDVASAPKNCGGRPGWGGTKSSYTHRLFVSLSQP